MIQAADDALEIEHFESDNDDEDASDFSVSDADQTSQSDIEDNEWVD